MPVPLHAVWPDEHSSWQTAMQPPLLQVWLAAQFDMFQCQQVSLPNKQVLKPLPEQTL
jgi:hypothetical protein